jgi:hypothetical protein
MSATAGDPFHGAAAWPIGRAVGMAAGIHCRPVPLRASTLFGFAAGQPPALTASLTRSAPPQRVAWVRREGAIWGRPGWQYVV